jgi:hypothetical protein
MVGRYGFLTLASLVAVGVGGVSLVAPEAILATKGIVGNAAAQVWVREVGALLLAVGFIAWRVRSHGDSATLRVLLWGNALLQLALLPIEVVAHVQGVIPAFIGIVPNSVLHIVLAAGFVVHARAVRVHA